MPDTPRKPGRPPILTDCLRCTLPKPRRDYVGTSSGICKECRRELRTSGAPVTVKITAEQIPKEVPPELRTAIAEGIGLKLANEGVTKLTFDLHLPPRCQCCFEHRHVARDTYGGVATVCARCDYQLRATGACHLHHSRVYYPELAAEYAARGGSGPAPTPIEVEGLFIVPESTRPKFDAAEHPDVD